MALPGPGLALAAVGAPFFVHIARRRKGGPPYDLGSHRRASDAVPRTGPASDATVQLAVIEFRAPRTVAVLVLGQGGATGLSGLAVTVGMRVAAIAAGTASGVAVHLLARVAAE